MGIRERIKILDRIIELKKQYKRIQKEKGEELRIKLIEQILLATTGEEAPFYKIKINDKEVETEHLMNMSTTDLIDIAEKLTKELEKIA